MATKTEALQIVAVAIATVLDASAAIATLTGHAAPQCVRMGGDLPAVMPVIVFQTQNAREAGGLLGSYLVDVELYAFADSNDAATTLLAAADDALTPLAFAGVGLDAVPESGTGANSDPLDPEDVPFPEAVGVATTLTLAVFLPS